MGLVFGKLEGPRHDKLMHRVLLVHAGALLHRHSACGLPGHVDDLWFAAFIAHQETLDRARGAHWELLLRQKVDLVVVAVAIVLTVARLVIAHNLKLVESVRHRLDVVTSAHLTCEEFTHFGLLSPVLVAPTARQELVIEHGYL